MNDQKPFPCKPATTAGVGDDVMIAGDVRTRTCGYCAKATTVWYEHYDEHTHISSLLIWVPNAIAWIKQRFEEQPASQHCLPKRSPGSSRASPASQLRRTVR